VSRRRVLGPLVASAAVVLGPTMVGRAQAATAVEAGDTRAVCRFETHETTTEGGNWVTPGHARNETLQPGTIDCLGTVAGRQLAEHSGTISYWYIGGTQPPGSTVGGENCVAWGGHGELTVSLPLADGSLMTLVGKFTARGLGMAGLTLGRLGNTEFVALAEFRPEPDHLDEDCVRKPLNHFIADAEMLIR